MDFIKEEQQAMTEDRVMEQTKRAYGKFCNGCTSSRKFLHKCLGSKDHECDCPHFSCRREREKRSQ
jgi:hypothetical protein